MNRKEHKGRKVRRENAYYAIVQYGAYKQRNGQNFPLWDTSRHGAGKGYFEDSLYRRKPMTTTTAEEFLGMVYAVLEEKGEVSNSNFVTLAMMLAMQEARIDAIELLVDKGCLDIEWQGPDGETFMHEAASGGHVAAMKWMKEEKHLDVNAQKKDGSMPIHLAADCGCIDAVKWLLDNGADVDAKGTKDRTPLHYAAWKGNIDVMNYLISKGANLYARDDGSAGSVGTPITLAVMAGQTESIRCLYAWDKEIIQERDSNGQTPMFSAAVDGKEESIICLKELGADVDARDDKGMTALFMAVIQGQIESMKCLKDLGAQLDAKSKNGLTLLKLADMSGQTEAADWLRANGAQ